MLSHSYDVMLRYGDLAGHIGLVGPELTRRPTPRPRHHCEVIDDGVPLKSARVSATPVPEAEFVHPGVGSRATGRIRDLEVDDRVPVDEFRTSDFANDVSRHPVGDQTVRVEQRDRFPGELTHDALELGCVTILDTPRIPEPVTLWVYPRRAPLVDPHVKRSRKGLQPRPVEPIKMDAKLHTSKLATLDVVGTERAYTEARSG